MMLKMKSAAAAEGTSGPIANLSIWKYFALDEGKTKDGKKYEIYCGI